MIQFTTEQLEDMLRNKGIDPDSLPDKLHENMLFLAVQSGAGGSGGGSKKTLIRIYPDNSCSETFADVRALVADGNAAFTLMAWGITGAPIQASWSYNRVIDGTDQSVIEAHIIALNDAGTALKVAKLIWDKQSGISVTSKTLSLS